MNIYDKISTEATVHLKKEIISSNGNEVFFRGVLDDTGKIFKVEALARGNKHSAPAIVKRMGREEVIIHNHPSGYLYPSDADIEVASYYANNFNGGFYIIDNDVSDIYCVVEVHREERIPVDIVPYFEKNGIISNFFPEFEYRKEQQHMAKSIQDGFNNGRKVIVEAGTGTGKTLAYLIPGIEWALKNKKKIIFSTNTINLQEQLLNKDIPLAKKVLGIDFKYLLVKGRGNYLCNRKLYNFLRGDYKKNELYSQIQKNQIRDILTWGDSTTTGDKSELLFEVDYIVWEAFQSETDICLGNKCPYKRECFFFKVRDEKKKADVLITNHHLYFTDLAIRKEIGFNSEFSILPEYGAIVFDEAHNIEKVARDYFSTEISKLGFVKLLNKIEFVDGTKRGSGTLSLVEQMARKVNNSEIVDLIASLRTEHINLFKEGKKYFDSIITSFTVEHQESVSIRIKKTDDFSVVKSKLNELTTEFLVSTNKYSRISRTLTRLLREFDDETGFCNELIRYLERVEEHIGALKFVDNMEDEDFIYWLEINRKRGLIKRVATPLKIDSELEKNLYVHLKTIIFTSATIAVGDSFKYFKESIGLKEDCIEDVIFSPFDYEAQMSVYVPRDICDPNLRNFNLEVSDFLKDYLIKSKGKTFVLFTSYSALNFVYYSIRDVLEQHDIDILVHGTLPRTQLIESYKNSLHPVLLGTDSFWEGVDIKGEQLSNVVIIKLPFKVPNDPITEAIIENIELSGKNSFTEYQIPEAVIKFKQGIGRLIRGKKDSGNIVILDNRIFTKKYGKYFLQAIPIENTKFLNKDEIIDRI